MDITSSGSKYQTNEPFSKINEKPNVDKSADFVLSFECESNPAIFDLTDKFSSISSIEVLKTRIERSEKTIESFRNCPFITLFNEYSNVLLDENRASEFIRLLGFSNITASELFDLFNDPTRKQIPVSRTFDYNYTTSTFHTIWWRVDWGAAYDPYWVLSPLWHCLDNAIVPYVLDDFNYCEKSLEDYLNAISSVYNQQFHNRIPYIYIDYDDKINRFVFFSYLPFILLPSNACSVVGLRPDVIYLPSFDIAFSQFYVWADHPPKLFGPDILYLQNNESMYSYRNSLYTSLSTIYLPDTGLYPYMNTDNTTYTDRQIQMISKNVNKLTFSLYSDQKHKFLYRTNGKKWSIQVVIHGICN